MRKRRARIGHESRADLTPGSRERILLKNGKLMDVVKAEYEERDMIISVGKIVSIQPSGTCQAEEYDYTVDLKGMYVIPGLINNHCHLQMIGNIPRPGKIIIPWLLDYKSQIEFGAQMCIAHGVTTVSDMYGSPRIVSWLKNRIGRHELVGPRILSCGRAIPLKGGYGDPGKMLNHIFEFALPAATAAEAAKAVRQNMAEGADFIKTFQQERSLFLDRTRYPNFSAKELAAIQDEAVKRGTFVAVHVADVTGFRKALDAGIRNFQHMPKDDLLTESDIKKFIDNSGSIIPTASVAWALSFKTRNDPNLEIGLVQRMIAHRNARIDSLLTTFLLDSHAANARAWYKKFSDEGYMSKKHILPIIDAPFFTKCGSFGVQNFIKLYEAGALFGCGNDGGIPFLFPGGLFLEMVILQELGIPPAEILRMATINNAKIIGREKELGSLKAGQRADMVILAHNPLQTMENLSSVEAVFRDGIMLYTKGKIDKEKV
jgi:imidazolonepropionase-like amidohydrolase